MANPLNYLKPGEFAQHRTLTGTPVAADAVLSAAFPNRAHFANAKGYETVLVYVIVASAGAGTVTLQPCLYDEDKDEVMVLANTSALATRQGAEIAVRDHRVFFRVDAVAGAPTSVEIRITPGNPSRMRG